jgi:hypothetical protein
VALHNTDTGRRRNAYKCLAVKAGGKRPFERTGLGWKDDIKVYGKEIGWKSMG